MALKSWANTDETIYGNDLNNNFTGLSNGTELALDSVRAFNSAVQTFTTGNDAAVTLNSERFDGNTMHDTTTNTSRLTAKRAGKYLITAQMQWVANATGVRILRIKLNNTTNIAQVVQVAISGSVAEQVVSTIYNLAVNDYVEMVGNQNSGGNLDNVVNGNTSPEFMMMYLGT